MKNFAIMSDKDNNLELIKDGFSSYEEAENYKHKNNLNSEYYFIVQLENIEN